MDFRNNNCSYLDFRADLFSRWKKKFGSIEVKWNGISTDVLDMLLKCGINPLSYDSSTNTLHCQNLADGCMFDIAHAHDSTVAIAICDWCVTYGKEFEKRFLRIIDKLDATIQQKISGLNTHDMEEEKPKNKSTEKNINEFKKPINNTILKDPINNKKAADVNSDLIEKIKKNGGFVYIENGLRAPESTQAEIHRILTKLGKKHPYINDLISGNIKAVDEYFETIKKVGEQNQVNANNADTRADDKYYVIEFVDHSIPDAANRRVALASKYHGYYKILFSDDYRVLETKVINSRVVSESMYKFIDTMADIYVDQNYNIESFDEEDDECSGCPNSECGCFACPVMCCGEQEDEPEGVNEPDPVETLIDSLKGAKNIAVFILHQDDNEDDSCG